MKLNKILAAVAAAAVLASSAACTKKQDYSSTDNKTTDNRQEETLPEATEPEPTEPPVVAAEDGPKLFIRDTEAAPGEYADVVVAVEDAKFLWSKCGIHITYPDVLEPEMSKPEEDLVDFERGKASNNSTASICMRWSGNKPEELSANNLGCVFFTEIFGGNDGMDGDIVTIRLKVPEDAQPGTEYEVGFMYRDGDMFINEEKDKSMEKFVFENWRSGKITVK